MGRAPVNERIVTHAPTVNPQPAPAPVDPACCGACPAWQRTHPQAPFGQCLAAIRWLGAPMYTPDRASCSLPFDRRVARQ